MVVELPHVVPFPAAHDRPAEVVAVGAGVQHGDDVVATRAQLAGAEVNRRLLSTTRTNETALLFLDRFPRVDFPGPAAERALTPARAVQTILDLPLVPCRSRRAANRANAPVPVVVLVTGRPTKRAPAPGPVVVLVTGRPTKRAPAPGPVVFHGIGFVTPPTVPLARRGPLVLLVTSLSAARAPAAIPGVTAKSTSEAHAVHSAPVTSRLRRSSLIRACVSRANTGREALTIGVSRRRNRLGATKEFADLPAQLPTEQYLTGEGPSARSCMPNLRFRGGFGLVTRQLLTRVALGWRYCAVTSGGGRRTCRQAVAAASIPASPTGSPACDAKTHRVLTGWACRAHRSDGYSVKVIKPKEISP